jgi:5S rRNA maturation endonuclease (ribonuclease M5)
MAGPGKRYQEFIEFLTMFVCELNALAQEGAVVVVEGKRDRDALAALGYTGPILTKATLHSKKGVAGLRRVKLAVILTDLDEEGRRLAARYADFFTLRGVKPSLTQRRRLLRASHGTFLHMENLVRFAPAVSEIIALTSKTEVSGPRLNK